MPFIEFICPKCGKTTEELVNTDHSAPLCPDCGEKMQQKYWGEIRINRRTPEHCSGNCKNCKGCG